MRVFRRLAIVAAATLVTFQAVSAAYARLDGAIAADPLDVYVQRAMADLHIPGAVVGIAHDGRPPAIRAFGLSNAELHSAMTEASVFRVGSVTKQFTAAMVLLLAQRGALALDDEVKTFLPDIPNVPAGVTVRHLLSHTSGIVDFTTIPNSVSFARLDRLPRDVVKPALELPLEFRPGERFSYSNTNYVLAAMIVERVGGARRFGAILQDNLFGPLGMSATRTDDQQAVIPGRANGYNWVDGTLLNAAYISPTNSFGSGNVISTVPDLLKWVAALHDRRVVNAAMLAQMLTPAVLSGGQPIHYGLGTELGERDGHSFVGHGGEVAGFNSQVVRYSGDRLTVVVLTNQGDAPTDEIAHHVAAIELGWPVVSLAPIPDSDPIFTTRFRQLLATMATGVADPQEFTEDAQREVLATIRRAGPEILGRRGPMTALVLVQRRATGDRRTLVYRESFAQGPSILWTIQLDAQSRIASLEPRLEQ
jgi:CubicO group peptidase (beta-lactamase class C family)